MIISASRRTDIPALYSEWFINRLHAGYLLVRNPMNRMQVSKISLLPADVDCFVFWTKNPLPMLKHLSFIDRYAYYFQFTVTSYDSSIERNLPPKKEIVDTFRRLSDAIGPDRVIWRYDPVFYAGHYDYSHHIKYFEYIAGKLSGYTERCMYSFITVYKKCEKNMDGISFSRPPISDMVKISENFSNICSSHNISLQTCAEDIDLSDYGISKGKCIDDVLIARISGKDISVSKDRNQRRECRCVESLDIGAYNTCTHRCIYCYANYDHDRALKNYTEHDPGSELIHGILTGGEIIRERSKHPGSDAAGSQGKLF